MFDPLKVRERCKDIKKNSKAVVLGAGRSGLAAARLLIILNVNVCLIEKNEKNINDDIRAEIEAARGKIICGEHLAEHFEDVDYIIPSPGIPVTGILPLLPAENSIEIIGELELAWRCMQGEPVLAITGTSGKTTTTSLAAAMLEERGLIVFTGGNIGTPLSEYILSGKKADVVVLEVSSFQLQTCTSFRPHVSLLLNITENHLDYHLDMQEYIDAKLNMFKWQGVNDVAIINSSLKNIVNEENYKAKVLWLDAMGPAQSQFEHILLAGAHNVINVEAAWLAAKEFGVSPAVAAQAVAKFAPLEHRLETVRNLDDVIYVNDSKCTTPSSLKVALEAFDKPIILLCGGKFKGGDLEGLRPLIKEKVKHIAMFGASRQYFEKAWEHCAPMTWSENLEIALGIAREQAVAGDVVLMAPATSSFDLYKDYMARGDDFKRVVRALS